MRSNTPGLMSVVVLIPKLDFRSRDEITNEGYADVADLRRHNSNKSIGSIKY